METTKVKGIVIRYFAGGFFVCDGQPPKGCEDDGEIYVGNIIKGCDTWKEAKMIKDIIDNAYS